MQQIYLRLFPRSSDLPAFHNHDKKNNAADQAAQSEGQRRFDPVRHGPGEQAADGGKTSEGKGIDAHHSAAQTVFGIELDRCVGHAEKGDHAPAAESEKKRGQGIGILQADRHQDQRQSHARAKEEGGLQFIPAKGGQGR